MNARLDKQVKQIVGYVRDYGRVALHVYGDEDGPPFTYSIGFPVSLDHPEVIIVGLTEELMKYMIDELWTQISEKGLRLTDGMRISNLLEGFDCVAREIVDRDVIDAYFCAGINYHQTQHGKDIERAFQIVWPDSAMGLFPWDPDCPEDVLEYQPALYPTSLNS